MKKIFLDDLPKIKNKIDWRNSIGKKVSFIYNELIGEIFIVDYIDGKLIVSYKDKTLKIQPTHFRSAKIGNLIGAKSTEFKIEIGSIFKDDKRDLIITDREYRKDKNNQNQKWYKYTCNKCGWTEGWIVEGNLIKNTGCSCCNGKIAVLGINTIWDTDRWMCDDMGLDEEFAKTHTKWTHEKGEFTCKDCGEKRKVKTGHVINHKGIYCSCGDGKSYPEKFMFSLLKQTKTYFNIEYSPEWTNGKRYDFFIPSLNMIIETHGLQHYCKNGRRSCSRTLAEEQENDRYKEQLAKDNGIDNYIVIDCRYSELEWIKNSILNSKINELFDLSNIDWLKCEEYALKNIVKEACLCWNKDDFKKNTLLIANHLNISRNTAIEYLKKGSNLKWCDYISC